MSSVSQRLPQPQGDIHDNHQISARSILNSGDNITPKMKNKNKKSGVQCREQLPQVPLATKYVHILVGVPKPVR